MKIELRKELEGHTVRLRPETTDEIRILKKATVTVEGRDPDRTTLQEDNSLLIGIGIEEPEVKPVEETQETQEAEDEIVKVHQ